MRKGPRQGQRAQRAAENTAQVPGNSDRPCQCRQTSTTCSMHAVQLDTGPVPVERSAGGETQRFMYRRSFGASMASSFGALMSFIFWCQRTADFFFILFLMCSFRPKFIFLNGVCQQRHPRVGLGLSCGSFLPTCTIPPSGPPSFFGALEQAASH